MSGVALLQRPGRRVYGLQVHGLDHVAELACASSPDGPQVEVGQVDGVRPAATALDGDRGVLLLADGRHLAVDRAAGTATFSGPHLSPDQLAHPHLGPVATVFNRWAAREAFHAGAVLVGGQAWGVLGPRTAGKSSLLAALAERGASVLSDDIVVTDGEVAYAGPRCLDLRQPLPGSGLATTPARSGTRLRVALPPVADRVPLGGWVFLGWGESSLAGVAPDLLLRRLAVWRAWRALPSDPVTLLRLATLSAWDLTRPRAWSAVPATLDRLLDTLSAAEPAAPCGGTR